MILAHKIRLVPNKTQERYFYQACGTARFVYNWARAQWEAAYKAGEKPNSITLKKQFNSIKYEQFPWLKDMHRDSHAQPFADLDRAYKGFFAKKSKYPQFKKKGKSKDSFYVAADKFTIGDGFVKLPKIGKIKTREDLRFTGKIMSARVTRCADAWFISIQVDCTVVPKKPKLSELPMGVDLGVKATATCTDGTVYNSSKPIRKYRKKLTRAQRSLSRKQKGSKNRLKQRMCVARLYQRITNLRQDFIHKMTTEIVRKSHAIVLEDLAVLNMLKNHKLAKYIADEGFAEIRRQIEYKCHIYDVALLISNRYFPSSRLCSSCGWKNTKLTLSDRIFNCESCGLSMDRDLNAAYNLVKQLPEAIGEVKPVDRSTNPAATPETGMKQESKGEHCCPP